MSHWKHRIDGVDWASMKLADRERVFQKVVKESGAVFEQPPFAIVWESPNSTEDTQAQVTVPSPEWWAMALHGGILPPVEVYWALKHDEAQPTFRRHTRGHLLHDTKPMRAMTPEEAMEYLVMAVLPLSVWRDYKGNRTILRIVPRNLIPQDRIFRNAWLVAQDAPVIEEEAA